MPQEIDRERLKAIEMAVGQIEKQFGKGSIMRLGQKDAVAAIPSISTGAVSLDYALGIGGVPRGRVVEIFGPESSGKTTLSLQVIAEAQKLSTPGSSASTSTTCSSRSPTTVNRRSKSSKSWSVRTASTSSSSTRSRRSCHAPKSKARWAKRRWGCRRG